MKEAELKKQVEAYLKRIRAEGRLLFFRLQAGNLFMAYKGKTRCIRQCEPGTPDYILLLKRDKLPALPVFLELKGEGGKLTEAQEEFIDAASRTGCQYWVIRSLDEVIRIVETYRPKAPKTITPDLYERCLPGSAEADLEEGDGAVRVVPRAGRLARSAHSSQGPERYGGHGARLYRRRAYAAVRPVSLGKAWDTGGVDAAS